MEAKLKFANDDSDGSVICHEYLDRLKIIRLLLSNNCPFIPSIEELKMPAVRRHICHNLIIIIIVIISFIIATTTTVVFLAITEMGDHVWVQFPVPDIYFGM